MMQNRHPSNGAAVMQEGADRLPVLTLPDAQTCRPRGGRWDAGETDRPETLWKQGPLFLRSTIVPMLSRNIPHPKS